MITPAYVRTMTAYNALMNADLYAAAAGLSDDARRADGGAFFGSIHATLCHLLWADHQWMSRFDGWEKPPVALAQSGMMFDDFEALRAERQATDAKLEVWAGRLREGDVEGSLSWFSGAVQRNMTAERALLLVHLFNHQTHHRGQVHALLTRAGAKPGATDLFVLVDAIR